MFNAQGSIYFMCICICVMITTSSAFTKQNGDHGKHKSDKKNEFGEDEKAINAAKIKLRSELQKKLAKMTAHERAEQSKIITEKLLKHPLYQVANKVGIYVSMESEVQTFDIIEDIFKSGKECFIPKYDKFNEMTLVKINSMDDLKSLPKTKYNITQPADNDVNREDALVTGGLDLIIVPGLGFSNIGERLGRGFGCYDRLLTKYYEKFAEQHCIIIGLSFTEQMCPKIPNNIHDRVVFFVINPEYELTY